MLQPSSSEPNPADDETLRVQRPKPDAPAFTFEPGMRAGTKLAEARRQLGLSLEEIAERIRVRREFLEALEAMNVKLLPGKAYALAFLRSYARTLGLDDDEIVTQFQSECALTREDAQKQIRSPKSKPHPERPWLFAAALVVLASGFVAWRALDKQPDPVTPAAKAAAHSTASRQVASSAPPLAVAEHHVVEIKALTQSWLEARGPDGTIFLSRTLQAGDVYRPDASPGWTLHARDGGAFELYVNGVDAGPLGTAGQPVLGRRIDDIQPLAQTAAVAPLAH